jgi:hypothetical protein
MTITNDYEAFIYVKDMLLQQDERSMDTNDNCQYRGYSANLCEKVRQKAEDWVIDLGDEVYSILDSAEDPVNTYFHEMMNDQIPDRKCAAGFLINDNFYHDYFEGNAVENRGHILDAIKLSNPAWKISDNSFNLIKTLQSVHDNQEPSDWGWMLDNIKKNFNEYNDYTGTDWENY